MARWITLLNLLFICVCAKENQSIISVDSGHSKPMLGSLLTNHSLIEKVFDQTVSSYLEHLPNGVSEKIVKGNFTYDEGGHPMISVNKAQILLLAALLTEHDERYHKDWPGHATIEPKEDEQSDLAKDGHVIASSIDDNLTGHVHLADEEDLQKMINQPPKLVRVRRAFFQKPGELWPQGIIPYVFDSKMKRYAKKSALKAMAHIAAEIPCITFRPVTKGAPNYVLISSQGAGCFTKSLGFKAGENVLNLGDGCGFPVIVHEMGHILGAIHTHNRPDRDDYVEINYSNVHKGYSRQFQKVNFDVEDSDIEYDYDSTMHYPSHAFAKAKTIPTIKVKAPNTFKLLKNGHNREGLSAGDITSFRDWYGCPKPKASQTGRKSSTENDKLKAKYVALKQSGKVNDQIENGREKDDLSDCLVSPWSKWSRCKKGRRAQFRNIAQGASGGTCPEEDVGKLLMIQACRSRKRRDAEILRQDELAEISEGEFAEVGMRKSVEVKAGQPIILVISNPNNLPVKWYHVDKDTGEGVEIKTGEENYHLTRTPVGNDKMVIESSAQEYDGHLFFAEITMSRSVLRITWEIAAIE